MANFWDDIADYLQDQGVGTVGTDIFVGKAPPTPDSLIAIIPSNAGSAAPNMYIRDLIYPRFQVYIRNEDWSAGADKLYEVRQALHVKIGLALNNHRALRIHAQQEGGPIGEDGQGRSEFSINFAAEAQAT